MILGNNKLSNYTFIDLFAGIGGFRIALESMGANCVFSSEIDNFAKETYKNNFNELPFGDITKVDAKSIPNHDILCAGFPCQPFSISGKGKGFLDTRGTLFFEVSRIVKEKKPKIVFMENVKNLVMHDNKKTIKIIESTMKDLGYNFHVEVLDASKYGIPQKRERVYIVCFRNDLKINTFSFPKPIKLVQHIEDILENNVSEKLYNCKYSYILKRNILDTYHSVPYRVGIVNKGAQGDRIYSIKGIGITLSAQGGGTFSRTGGYLIGNKVRKLSTRECARLMGFPDDFKICTNETQAYKQFGNSVVIDVLQYILFEIESALSL